MWKQHSDVKSIKNTMNTCMYVCILIHEHVLFLEELIIFILCARHWLHHLKLPVTCRLTSQRPEGLHNAPHMHVYSHICKAEVWYFPDAPPLSLPPYIAWHSHPLRSPHLPHTLNQSNTHSHNGTSPISLNPAYQTFRFFSFPYPCTDITLHSQSPHFVSSSIAVLFNPLYDSQCLHSENCCKARRHFCVPTAQVWLR